MRILRFLPRFRLAYRQMETLASRQRWSRTEIESWQLERLNGIWAHAIAHVPYYRALAARDRLPGRFASLAEFQATLPILPRSEIKVRPADFLSEKPAPGSWHVSSGTT